LERLLESLGETVDEFHPAEGFRTYTSLRPSRSARPSVSYRPSVSVAGDL
jgi:hypothetical protein